MTREIDPQLVDSLATRMLAEGLGRASQERGLSLRKLSARLGYKQAVVLSHMATGRVPIPIDRAEDIARELEIDPAAFLQAVVEQRHPEVTWSLLGAEAQDTEDFSNELAVSLGKPLRDLSTEQRAVMREVAAEPNPRRRWVTVHELIAIEVLREARPTIGTEGLSPAEIAAVRAALLANTPDN
jgi:transcriptional regulator with XRE-family HTH domain